MNDRAFQTAEAAEEAFYLAFEQGDLDTMLMVWDEGEHVECIHPMGERLRGAQVQASWRHMFRTPRALVVELSERHCIRAGTLAIHVVTEIIRFDGGDQPLHILGTNIFRLTDTGWRMIAHHASPAPHVRRERQSARGAALLH